MAIGYGLRRYCSESNVLLCAITIGLDYVKKCAQVPANSSSQASVHLTSLEILSTEIVALGLRQAERGCREISCTSLLTNSPTSCRGYTTIADGVGVQATVLTEQPVI